MAAPYEYCPNPLCPSSKCQSERRREIADRTRFRPRRVPVIGVTDLPFSVTLSDKQFAEAERGNVITTHTPDGVRIAALRQTSELRYANGTVRVDFLTQVGDFIDRKDMDAGLAIALRAAPSVVLGDRK